MSPKTKALDTVAPEKYQAPPTTQHTLLRAHKHGGRWHGKDDKIVLTEAQAVRLRAEDPPKIK